MKRDWIIIRAILLKLEASPTATTVLKANELTEFAEQEVAYNMRLLHEAGYIKANIIETMSGGGAIAAAIARTMTNSGHELLDTIRSDTVWEKIKDRFSANGLEMTFDLVLLTGKKIIEAMIS
jgi:repressor of nif and glnA expression